MIVLCGMIKDRVDHEFLNGDVGMAGSQIVLQAKAILRSLCKVGHLHRLLDPNWPPSISLSRK